MFKFSVSSNGLFWGNFEDRKFLRGIFFRYSTYKNEAHKWKDNPDAKSMKTKTLIGFSKSYYVNYILGCKCHKQNSIQQHCMWRQAPISLAAVTHQPKYKGHGCICNSIYLRGFNYCLLNHITQKKNISTHLNKKQHMTQQVPLRTWTQGKILSIETWKKHCEGLLFLFNALMFRHSIHFVLIWFNSV